MNEVVNKSCGLDIHKHFFIATIIWHLVTKDEIYEDGIGYQKGEIQKKKIVEIEPFSIDESIKIVSGVIVIS